MTGFEGPVVEWALLAPELILIVGALLILGVSPFLRERQAGSTWSIFALAVAGSALISTIGLWEEAATNPRTALAGALVLDGFGVFATVAICTAVGLGVLVADGYLWRERLDQPAFYVLMLISAAGGVLMAKANDLIVVFLGLEVLSIALYVMAGFHHRERRSTEAAVKYFLLGSFSSAVFLYGVALTYGATGTTNLAGIAAFLRSEVVTGGVLFGGLGLIFVGLGFKVAAVPFHMWTPDVYQGSPSPVTGFMAAAAKTAGFAALLRIAYSAFSVLRLDWQPMVWALAVASLVVGSVAAVIQTDVKRMLAFSSISHAGYVLVGLAAASDRGVSGSLYYLLAYTFMVLGSFAVVTVVGRLGDRAHSLDDYRGLSRRSPVLALCLTVLLLAQAGAPFTTGFLAKFGVIFAAVEAESYSLAVVAMLAAVVATFFYLRLIVVMFMTADSIATHDAADGRSQDPVGADPAGVAVVGGAHATGAHATGAHATGAYDAAGSESDEAVRAGGAVAVVGSGPGGMPVPVAAALAIALAVAVTVIGGLAPEPLIDFARQATLLPQ
ncbi:MAG: NADH-quinone oxidoreductase subunit N [Acidimicrobiales bacterium]